MGHPLMNSVHNFYIPVMGTGFTIDTPLKVAKYGISSVVSLVDDVLIEQMRQSLSRDRDLEFEEIPENAPDSRAKRITSYLNMMDDVVERQVEKMRTALFETGSEISKYFEMLPDSPLRSLYQKMQTTPDPEERESLQDKLRGMIRPGGIDVNIMTKLDRAKLSKGKDLGPKFSDAMSALRGYAQSKLQSSVILSAGMNRKLFGYLSEFGDFFPDETGEIRKRIVLKVSDFRSALIQGKLLARQGLWVSEYRIESGLNCGGHAFGGKGTLLGPVLQDFRDQRQNLRDQLHEIWVTGLNNLGRTAPGAPLEFRVTVQGGIGTAEESHMLVQDYRCRRHRLGQPVSAGAGSGEHRPESSRPHCGRRRGRCAPERGLAPGRAVLVPEDLGERSSPPAPYRAGQAGQRLPEGLPGQQHRIHQGAHLHGQSCLSAP